LKNPVNDAKDLTQKLAALGFYCKLYAEASFISMDDALKEFALELSWAYLSYNLESSTHNFGAKHASMPNFY
jgi:hypothetical protein